MTDNIVVEQDTVIGEDFVDLNEDTTNHDLEDQVVDNDEVVEDEITLPEKFKDKSIEEVVASYTNLEKEFGRKNNELGEQRKLIDQLLELKLEEGKKTTDKQEAAQKVDVDALLDDPDRVISEAVANDPVLKEIRENQANALRDKEKLGFEAKHNDWQDVVSSNEFAEWVTSSPVRTQMFQDANTNYKYDVADELLTLYKSIQGVKQEQAKAIKKENAKQVMKDAATEKGATNATTKKMYRRNDLINLRINDPDRWASMQDEIMLAYAEKRVK